MFRHTAASCRSSAGNSHISGETCQHADAFRGLLAVSVALNKVILLGTSRTEVKIISEKSAEIRQAILSRVDRGVTMLCGRGGYSGKDTEVIMSVVSNYELPKIESLARAIDPDCFIIVSQVTEVWGRGFTYGKKEIRS